MGDLGSIPGLGRSPGEGKGYPFQYSGLENSMDCVCSPWGCKELDMTEQFSLSYSVLCTVSGDTAVNRTDVVSFLPRFTFC